MLIIFDLDGTIIQSGEGIIKSFEYSLAKMGLEVPNVKELEKFIGPPLEDTFRNSLGFTEQEADRALFFYREHYAKSGKSMNKIYAGVEETIKELSKEHVLAVGTSKLEESARDIIEYFNLEKYFAFVGGAAMDGSRNTKAKVLKYVLENIGGYDSEDIYMIGDRFYDIKGAKELNLKSIGVKWGYGEEKELIDAGADYIVNNTDELKELVKTIK